MTTFTGGNGNDSFVGTANDDYLSGLDGDDTLIGSNGTNDYVVSDDGDDTLVGGDGNDDLDGGQGQNSLSGGAGDDTLHGGVKALLGGWRTAADTLDGGDGIDLAYVYASHGPAVDFSLPDILAGPVTLADGSVLRSIERVHFEGSAYADSLVGGALDDVLVGWHQDDTLIGGDGNDYLHGGWDNDTLIGGNGNDFLHGSKGLNSLSGGAGDDVLSTSYFTSRYPGGHIVSRAMTTDTLDGGDGIDLAFVYTYSSAAVNFAVSDNLARAVTLPDGSVLSNIEQVHFEGSDYADSLVGGALHDVLMGRGGNDTLLGRGGNDDLAGLEGNDALLGGRSADRLDGGDGADRLRGSDGSDRLLGGAGKDTLNGGNGADILDGDRGADRLIGGHGNDSLTGAAGADAFLFDTRPTATGNVDTVTDFTPGIDRMILDDAVFTAFDAGVTSTLQAGQFHAGAGATAALDATQRIVYDTESGTLYYDVDGAGGVAALPFAVLGLNTHPALTADDFLIHA